MSKYVSIDNHNVESGTFNSCFIRQASDSGEVKIYEPYPGYLYINADGWSVEKVTSINRTEGSVLSSNLKILDALKSESYCNVHGRIEIQNDISLSKLNSDVNVAKTGGITITPNPNHDIKEPYLHFTLLDGFMPIIDIRVNHDDFLRITEDIKQKKLHSLHLQLSELEGFYESTNDEKLMVIDQYQQIKKAKGSVESPTKIGEVGNVVIREIYETYHGENKTNTNEVELENQEIIIQTQVELLKKEIKLLSEKYDKNASLFNNTLKWTTFLLIALLFTRFI